MAGPGGGYTELKEHSLYELDRADCAAHLVMWLEPGEGVGAQMGAAGLPDYEVPGLFLAKLVEFVAWRDGITRAEALDRLRRDCEELDAEEGPP